MDSKPMTAEGLATLRAELERLESSGRSEISEQIKTAREWGDLKENAEYHAAKEAQAHLETRILQLRNEIAAAEVVDVEEAASDGSVAFGSTVVVEGEDGRAQQTYRLVSSHEAAPAKGLLSYESPVAVALRGHAAGETVTVVTPRGPRNLRIVSVS